MRRKDMTKKNYKDKYKDKDNDNDNDNDKDKAKIDNSDIKTSNNPVK